MRTELIEMKWLPTSKRLSKLLAEDAPEKAKTLQRVQKAMERLQEREVDLRAERLAYERREFQRRNDERRRN